MAFLASLPGLTGWALVLPGGYLLLVAVLALISALSARPSRRDAAFRVLQLIWWSRRSRGGDNELPRAASRPRIFRAVGAEFRGFLSSCSITPAAAASVARVRRPG